MQPSSDGGGRPQRTPNGVFCQKCLHARTHERVHRRHHFEPTVRRYRQRQTAEPRHCQCGGDGHEKVGNRTRRNAFHALVSAIDGRHSRKTRRFRRKNARRPRVGGVFGQCTLPARTRCVEFSERRHTQHFRGARLLGVGPVIASVCGGRHALHSNGFCGLYGRSTRLQNAALAQRGGSESRCGRCLPPVRPQCVARTRLSRLGAGVFFGR